MVKIKIDDVAHKVSKAGKPYATINGIYTCHETNLIKILSDNVGTEYNLEVVDSADGKWHNIRKIVGEGEAVEPKQGPTPRPVYPIASPAKSEKYELTEGSKRCNALIAAVEFTKNDAETTIDGLLNCADLFVKWIN